MSHIGNYAIDVEKLTFALEHDERFFINFFLVDQITEKTPVPQFHVDVFRRMFGSNSSYFCAALPRDHAKSTLAKLACIKFWLFTQYRFIVYVSNTSEMAANYVNDIVGFLESDNFREYHNLVCGKDIHWMVRQEFHGFYRFILFPDHPKQKECIIKTLGIGKQVRGLLVDNQRPQVGVCDDIESSESLETEKGYNKNKRWFYGPFKKALDKFSHRIIQLGNMTAWQCLVKDHTESEYWDSYRVGAVLSSGSPLWPEAWPLEKLYRDLQEYKSQGMVDVWFAEMMNMPIPAGMGLIEAEQIFYAPVPLPEDVEFAFITVDPAISSKTWGHRTGIAVHAFVDPYWMVVETRGDRGLSPIDLFDKVISLGQKWNALTIGVEAVAYQAAIKPVFEHLVLTNRIEGFSFVDLYAGQQKTERFLAWAGQIKKKNWALRKDDFLLTQQLLTYDPKRKDNDCDILDAAAYGTQMVSRYLDIIMNTFKGGMMPQDARASLYEIAGI